MAKETITKCDGCGAVDKPDSETAETLIQITAGGEALPYRVTRDLCPKCIGRARIEADPANWSRRRTRKAAKG